jgi:hypothetical protein
MYYDIAATQLDLFKEPHQSAVASMTQHASSGYIVLRQNLEGMQHLSTQVVEGSVQRVSEIILFQIIIILIYMKLVNSN